MNIRSSMRQTRRMHQHYFWVLDISIGNATMEWMPDRAKNGGPSVRPSYFSVPLNCATQIIPKWMDEAIVSYLP